MSQRERAPGGGTRLTVDRAYGARGRDAAGRWRRAGGGGGGGPPPPGAREPAGRERRSRRARRAHSRRAPSHPAASERDGLTDPAPAGPGQRRRRRGEAGEDTHTSPPPTRADPPTTRWRRASEGRSPGQVAPRLAQQAGAHAHAGRGPGRDPGTPPPGGRARGRGAADDGQAGTRPTPRRAHARAGGGGGTAEEGGRTIPPRLHTTPPPGRTVAADTERRPQRAWEAPAHQSAATGFGSRTEEATTRTPGGKGNEAPAKSDGEQDGGPTAREPHGFPTRCLEGAEPSRHRGAHGVPPPEASSTRAVPWHPRTPTRPAPSANPGANPRRGPSGPATRSSRATGP